MGEMLTGRPDPIDAPVGSARITLEMPPIPACVSLARGLVGSAARLLPNLDGDKIDGLLVAVSEACTNAIEAHQRAGFDTPVRLRLKAVDGEFEVVVEDFGSGFDPGRIPPRPPAGDPDHLAIERGWGIGLMDALVDDLVFDLRDDGTRVHLIVRNA